MSTLIELIVYLNEVNQLLSKNDEESPKWELYGSVNGHIDPNDSNRVIINSITNLYKVYEGSETQYPENDKSFSPPKSYQIGDDIQELVAPCVCCEPNGFCYFCMSSIQVNENE